jgi:ABC-type oligopeptide transport system substrate-binding subunit
VRGGFVWPGIGLDSVSTLTTDNIGSERNAWKGRNYSGYSSPAYDTLYERFAGTLDTAARQGIHADIMALVADQVPIIPIYYYGNVVLFRKSLVGPAMITPLQTASAWNIHTWELR